MADSNACSFCNGKAETVEHLFFNCEMVRKFWKEYAEWWSLFSGKCINLIVEYFCFRHRPCEIASRVLKPRSFVC